MRRRVSTEIPNDPRAQNNLGNIAWSQKKNAAAADHFERAIALDEKNTTALRNLGAVRQELKQYAEALKGVSRIPTPSCRADSDIRDLVESLEEYLKPDPIPEPVAQVEPEPEPKEEVKPEPVVAEVTPEEPEPNRS